MRITQLSKQKLWEDKGKNIMLTTFLIMTLSVNGGLYVGTIAYTAFKSGI